MWVRLTPLVVTADKTVSASLYTTTDDNEVGDTKSSHLITLGTRTDGGSDEWCCGPLYASDGIYVEVHENDSGATTDSAYISVGYVSKENYADGYADIGAWRGKKWKNAEGREMATFGDSYIRDVVLPSEDVASDGGVDSGAGGAALETEGRVLITDEMLSVIKTGKKET